MSKTSAALFSTGDIVQLRTGGIEFVVKSQEQDQVTIAWCDGSKLKTETLPALVLKRTAEDTVSDLERARRVSFLLNKTARELPGYSEVTSDNIEELTTFILNHWKTTSS